MTDNFKLQWSIKLDTGEIFVCQAENAEELGLSIQEIKQKFLNQQLTTPKPIETPVVASPTASQEHFCELHKTPLKERIFRGRNFGWDHRKEEDGVWYLCKGEGWKAQ